MYNKTKRYGHNICSLRAPPATPYSPLVAAGNVGAKGIGVGRDLHRVPHQTCAARSFISAIDNHGLQAVRVEIPAPMAELSETVSQRARDFAGARKQHAGKLSGQVGDELRDMDYQSRKRGNGSITLNGLLRVKHRVAPLPSRK
jgi:hypothetical protein